MQIQIITHIHSSGQFFISNDHCQGLKSEKTRAMYEGFSPVTATLPMEVTPRKGIENGIVDTLDKYLLAFHDGDIQIPNPDSEFFPKFIALKGIAEGNRFWTHVVNGEDPRKLNDDTVAYEVLGYFNSAEDCQRYLYGNAFVNYVHNRGEARK